MRRLILLAVVAAPLLAWAQAAPRGAFSGEDAGDRQGEEREPPLPAFPRDESLLRISIDVRGSFEYFVDPESLSVGQDGVVRYVLVARSDAGATNVAFEGIRCRDRERKLYALGRADRTWSPVRNQRWATISDLPVNIAEATLHDRYFCPGRIIVRDVEEARKALKAGGNPRAQLPN